VAIGGECDAPGIPGRCDLRETRSIPIDGINVVIEADIKMTVELSAL